MNTRAPRLRLVATDWRPTEATRRMFAEFGAQAADLAARLARRGEVDGSLKALQVARTVLERAQDGKGER